MYKLCWPERRKSHLRTGFAARDDVPRPIIASEGGQAVGRLEERARAFERQIFTVRNEGSRDYVFSLSVFDGGHHTRSCS